MRDPAGIAMDDADVAAMAAAWPSLEVLDIALPEDGPRRGVARPSAASLQLLARGCTRLETLRIPLGVDVSALPDPSEGTDGESESSYSQRCLRTLWVDGVCFSRTESEQVVAFLTQVFPLANLKPMVDAGVLRVR